MDHRETRATRDHEIAMSSGPSAPVAPLRDRLLAGLPVTDRRMQVTGLQTAVVEGGSGPPLLLLHGPGEHGLKWLRVIPDLVRTHRVVAPDLPGHGASEPLAREMEGESVLDWLDALIDSTCPQAPALVGQTLGGAIAGRFTARRPHRVSRLVLVDSLGLTTFQPSADFGEALSGFLSAPGEVTHERLWRLCAFDLDALAESLGARWPLLKAYNLQLARTPALRSTQQILMQRFGMEAIPAAELERIAVPVTLIWGRHDLATPLPVAEAAGALRRWPVHVIEKAADDPPLEQPEAFLEALRAALGDPL